MKRDIKEKGGESVSSNWDASTKSLKRDLERFRSSLATDRFAKRVDKEELKRSFEKLVSGPCEIKQYCEEKPLTVEAMRWNGWDFETLSRFTGVQYKETNDPLDLRFAKDNRGVGVMLPNGRPLMPGSYLVRCERGSFLCCCAEVFETFYKVKEGDDS